MRTEGSADSKALCVWASLTFSRRWLIKLLDAAEAIFQGPPDAEDLAFMARCADQSISQALGVLTQTHPENVRTLNRPPDLPARVRHV